MAGWNRPATDQPVTKKGGAKKPTVWKGLAAGLVVVALGVVCVCVFSGKDDAPECKVAKGQAKIKEVQPALALTNAVAAAPAPIDKSKLSPAWQKYYDGRDTNKWKVVYNPVTKKEYISRRLTYGSKNAPQPIYENHALNVLDALAFKPIVSPMANVHADERFMKNLQQALIDKVEIKPDDSDEIKSRKQAMIELLGELKERLRAGEDLQKVINDSIAERNSIAAFKREVVRERARMEREGASAEDVQMYEQIANKKLAEKGAVQLINRQDALKKMQEARELWEQNKSSKSNQEKSK